MHENESVSHIILASYCAYAHQIYQPKNTKKSTLTYYKILIQIIFSSGSKHLTFAANTQGIKKK